MGQLKYIWPQMTKPDITYNNKNVFQIENIVK